LLLFVVVVVVVVVIVVVFRSSTDIKSESSGGSPCSGKSVEWPAVVVYCCSCCCYSLAVDYDGPDQRHDRRCEEGTPCTACRLQEGKTPSEGCPDSCACARSGQLVGSELHRIFRSSRKRRVAAGGQDGQSFLRQPLRQPPGQSESHLGRSRPGCEALRDR